MNKVLDWLVPVVAIVGIIIMCSFVVFVAGAKTAIDLAESNKVSSVDYLEDHHCEAEDILMVDGNVKVRYLCDGDEANDDL